MTNYSAVLRTMAGAYLLCVPSVYAAEPSAPMGHHHGHSASTEAVTEKGPPLSIVLPEDGAVMGPHVAIVFRSDGDMSELTMSAARIGTHLHIDTTGISMMPTVDQLQSLGSGHYLFQFDLPFSAGPHTVNVYWSDSAHRTIESSIVSVDLHVED